MRNFEIEAYYDRMLDDPEEYAENTWKTLKQAILEIYNQHSSDLSFEELHRSAYNMVRHKFGEKLYSGLVSTITSHLKEIALSLENSQGALFLEVLDRKWSEHNKALLMIRRIFMYLDNTYIPDTHKTPVHELGLNLWKDNIVNSIKIQMRLKDSLAEIVQKERGGEVISSRGVMRNNLRMLMDLGSSAYEEYFESPFLAASADFYRAQSQLFLESCDCGDYLQKAEKLVNEEIQRVSRYLDVRSELKMTNLMENVMIESQMARLVKMENSGLVSMLLDDKYEDLGRMYNLFRRVPNGLVVIRDVMTSHLREMGRQFVCDPERLKDPLGFVQRLLDEQAKYDKIIHVALKNDDMFQNVVSSSFQYFINLNTRSPEFVSLFVDDKLRKALKSFCEEDVEIVLDKVMMLFRYLEEKDVFETYYRKHLATRLLNSSGVSEVAESSFILKLKTQCGHIFTSNLEGMFQDIKTSDDTMQGFYEAMGHELGDGPSLAVRVLTTGFWPTQSTATCKLPPEILTACNKFKAYYLGAHSGRRLTWQTSLGSAVLVVTFDSGRKHELHVSTYQMCVLMLFNVGDGLSYRELEEATEIPTSDLKKCLKSLACAKHKNVLIKEPNSEEIGEEDKFFFNEKFASMHFKVDIMVVEIESAPEKKETKQKVEGDRKLQIEAAIVRIMKARLKLHHNNLITEVTKLLQTRFLPNPADIKKRVENLIDREFLKRDKSDRMLYSYLA